MQILRYAYYVIIQHVYIMDGNMYGFYEVCNECVVSV